MDLKLERKEYENLTYGEMLEKCQKFFSELVDISKDHYFLVDSCNNDVSQYLVLYGTQDEELSYYNKPSWNFRISDHWNWYANVKKCHSYSYIQCLSVDMPRAKKRLEAGKASKPILGYQVCIFGDDEKYHCVYGECYDRKEKKWYWIESDPKDIYEMVLTFRKR